MKRIALCALVLSLAHATAFAQAEPESQEVLTARLNAANAQLAQAKAELAMFERAAKDAAARKARTAAAEKTAHAQTVAKAETASSYPEPKGVYDDDQPAKVAVVKIAGTKKYDPLRLKMVMRFPSNVKTIQQATQYMLETVDYKLTLSPLNPEETRKILSRPLLPQDRIGGLQTIEDGLLQISGDDTVLIIDRENKLISFELQSKKSK